MADRPRSMLEVKRWRPVVLVLIAAVSVASCGSTATPPTSSATQAVGQPAGTPAASVTAAKPPSEEPYALIGRVRVRGGAARRYLFSAL